MSEHPLDQLRIELGLEVGEIIKSWRRSKNRGSDWAHIRRAYSDGTLMLKTIRKLANAFGIPVWLMFLMLEDIEGTEDSQPVNMLEVLKNVKARNPDLAFELYRELVILGKNTKEIDAWVDENF